MTRKTSWIVGCIALAAVLSLLVTPANATLIIGFQFTDNSTSVTVPVTGGTYTVNVWASSDVVGLTDLQVKSGYVGALSTILNSETIDGDVTANNVPAAWGGTNQNGDMTDLNGDGRTDLGCTNGTTKLQSTGSSTIHPWWMRMISGATAVSLGGTAGTWTTFTSHHSGLWGWRWPRVPALRSATRSVRCWC